MDDYFEYLIIIILVSFSAIFSGLTLGFFSLSKDNLKRKAEIGDKRAKKVYEVRKNGNLLLCTLLIGNVAVNAALSIFLGSIASGFTAGLIATALIVIFGEILPQATFSRYALEIGSKLAFAVKVFIFILLPITWPLARILDWILGEEMPTIYSKKELAKLIEDHENSHESEIDEDEERIIKGALSYSEKKVRDIMTPRVAMFCLSANKKVDEKLLKRISDTGHSRIPVYEKNLDNIIGILYVKDLINTNWKDKKVRDVARKDVIFVDHTKPLDDLLNEFKKTRHHLFIVLDEFGGVAGLVTIEDVLEEIIGAEIVDEFDKHEDLRALAKRRRRELRK